MGLINRLISNKFNPNLAVDLQSKSKSHLDKMQTANIIVAGKTGSGKSTLINAIFREKIAQTGVGKPITQHIQEITKEGLPVVLYDTKGLELSQRNQKEVLTTLADLIKVQAQKGPKAAINLVYYCINNSMGRIEDFEIELIQALAKKVPVILVLTQTLGQERKDFETYLKELKLPVRAIIPVLAKPYLLTGKEYLPSFGLQALIDMTIEVLPEESQGAFINAQQVDLDRKVARARRWAKRYITTAFGVGFIPIPVADSAVLVPMQIGMLAHISSIFGVSLDKSQILSVLAGIGGTGGATLIGKYLVSSATKLIPGLGTVTGGLISGATASSLTVALAYSYIEVLKQVTLAEKAGRDMPLKEIQRLMNSSLKEQFETLSEVLPEGFKDINVVDWAQDLFNKKKK